MREVQDALKDASRLLLATDPDRYECREGQHACDVDVDALMPEFHSNDN